LPSAKKADETLPLGEMYSSNGQTGLKEIIVKAGGADGLSGFPCVGASNAVMVRAATVEDALLEPSFMFQDGRADTTNDYAPRATHKRVWFAASLGVSKVHGTTWHVKAAERTGNTLRLIFTEAPWGKKEAVPCLVLVPLDELTPGDYTLELVCASDEQTTFVRRVTVLEQNRSSRNDRLFRIRIPEMARTNTMTLPQRILLILGGASSALFVVVLAYPWNTVTTAAPFPRPAEAVQNIPLEQVHSFSSQDGISHIEKDYNLQVEVLGPSTILIVRGETLDEAVWETRAILQKGEPADRLSLASEQGKRESAWLCAYIGMAGSDPPQWVVQSVERKDNTIRFVYGKPVDLFVVTRDRECYCYWIPLGQLDSGTYVLEMWNSDRREWTVRRQVEVK